MCGRQGENLLNVIHIGDPHVKALLKERRAFQCLDTEMAEGKDLSSVSGESTRAVSVYMHQLSVTGHGRYGLMPNQRGASAPF
jgi:hypothetical protein